MTQPHPHVDTAELRARVEAAYENPNSDRVAARATVSDLIWALDRGQVRAAEKTEDGWKAVTWVKQGILLAFRFGDTKRFEPFAFAQNPDFGGSVFRFADRDTLPLRNTDPLLEGVRVVPGGSSVRAGSHLARLYQHRRLRGRGRHDRFARSGRFVRSGWEARPSFGRRSVGRRAGAGRTSAGDH